MTPAEQLALTIRNHFLGVRPEDQSMVLEDHDYRRIIVALEAVRVARQLATIAGDWNLDEVEIDGTFVLTGDVGRLFREVLTETEAAWSTPGMENMRIT